MLNWAENYPSVIELYQTADHPALSPKSCHLQWRILPHHVENPPPKPAVWLGGGGGGEDATSGGLAWLTFTTNSFLMISPNLHDIWPMFFLVPYPL
jgi:hypothetical protein